MEKNMTKALITSIVVWLISFIIVTLTKEGQLQFGDFSLMVPDTVYSIATWLLGLSTSVTIPVAIKYWLVNRYNVLMNAGLQDMKLTHMMDQQSIMMEAQVLDVLNINTIPKAVKDDIEARMNASLQKSEELRNTHANFMSVDSEQKKSYIMNQIDMNETLKRRAEQMGDTKTIKLMDKAISTAYSQLKKL